MLHVAKARVEEKATAEMINKCDKLFNEWLEELSSEEKEIWLWNATVEMLKIRQRREN